MRTASRRIVGDECIPEGRELFVVALAGNTGTGWLVDATGVEEARRIVHGTVLRAPACWLSELLVWTAPLYRARYLGGADSGPEWVRLAAEGET